jgi:hypothetical protein
MSDLVAVAIGRANRPVCLVLTTMMVLLCPLARLAAGGTTATIDRLGFTGATAMMFGDFVLSCAGDSTELV